MDIYKVELVLTEPMLGTVPKDESIYTTHVQNQAIEQAKKNGIELTDEQLEQEVVSVKEMEVEEKGWTGFHEVGGQPILYDYVIKGFLKEACSILRRVSKSRSSKLTAFRKVVDGMVFIMPRQINLVLPGEKELGTLERPLRAQTAQGERVALARSDTCPVGTLIEFEVRVLGVVSKVLLEDWFDYGQFKGLGQWRNGGYGRFTYELDKM